MAHESPDDEFELMRAWQGGSVRSGEKLFNRYFAAIKRFFLSKNVHGVEDLVQETFLAVQNARDRIEKASFRNYLFGAAHNILRVHLRRRHEERFDSKQMSVADLNPGMSSMIAALDQERVLQLALQRVPLDDQIVLELYYFEKMTGPEIADTLDLRLGTVRTRIRRSLTRLGKMIAEIEASPELLDMTLRDFSRWRADLRAMLGITEDENEGEDQDEDEDEDNGGDDVSDDPRNGGD